MTEDEEEGRDQNGGARVIECDTQHLTTKRGWQQLLSLCSTDDT